MVTRRGMVSWMMALMVALGVGAHPAPAEAAPMEKKEMRSLLERIDERQSTLADYKALVFIDQKRKGEPELVYEAVVYRRDEAGKLVIMFLKPKSEAGKGYLKIEDNLFLYDPSVGKWERRTDRENIGGTASQRRDFDATTFSEDYNPTYLGEEKLGKYDVHHLELTAKEGKEVAYPKVQLWVDTETENILKIQEFALSGRLMRTAYYPKWSKVPNPVGDEPFYFPKQIRIFDEVEKGNSTTIVMRKVDLSNLPDNIFTKAWIEQKSR